jgi:hypothetical protein
MWTTSKRQRLFVIAPPRSGSTLLAFLVNKTPNCVMINEPVGSRNIHRERDINGIFEVLDASVDTGFVFQRTRGKEAITDTFSTNILPHWSRISVDPACKPPFAESKSHFRPLRPPHNSVTF